MSAIDPALLPLKRYADFSGRSTRTELVSFLFLAAVVQTAAVFAASVVHRGFGEAVSALFALALLCPWLAVVVRRFHDQGKSAWWLLLFPVMVLLVAAVDALGLGRSWISMLLRAAMVVALWTLLLWKGQEGENRFDRNPRFDESVSY